MYQLIPQQSCGYLNKILMKANVATNERNGQNQIWQWTNDAIRVAVPSLLLVGVENMTW